MNHLIFDMAGEFEGERVTSVSLWKGNGIQHYFTAAEPRGKTDLKAAARQAIKDGRASRLRGNARTRLHDELGKECSHQLVWILTCTVGRRVEDTSCLGRYWIESKVVNWRHCSYQIMHLRSVDECHGCGLLDVPSKPWTQVTGCGVRH